VVINDTNIQQTSDSPKKGEALDTLAQLRKRAKAKAITNAICFKLVTLDSPLEKSYRNTLYCSDRLDQANGKITTKYCKNRWCLVCNRIRTAKLINTYSDPMEKLQDPQLVTLTIPNMIGSDLPGSIAQMTKTFQKIKNTMRLRETPIVGIRKLEVTYNPKRKDFHPHFHLIIEGEDIALDIVNFWLKHFPLARESGQDIRRADMNAGKELFKYFTKLLIKVDGKTVFIPQAMDTIFRSMKGRRVFQAMGMKREAENVEDIEDLKAIEDLELETNLGDDCSWFWQQDALDWVNIETGEILAGYNASSSIKNLIDIIGGKDPP